MDCGCDNVPEIINVGVKGDKGDKGWSPLIRVVEVDADTNVLELYAWTGGEGTRPTTIGYLASTGIVSNPALALNVKGEKGDNGDTFTTITEWVAGNYVAGEIVGVGTINGNPYYYAVNNISSTNINAEINNGDWLYVGQQNIPIIEEDTFLAKQCLGSYNNVLYQTVSNVTFSESPVNIGSYILNGDIIEVSGYSEYKTAKTTSGNNSLPFKICEITCSTQGQYGYLRLNISSYGYPANTSSSVFLFADLSVFVQYPVLGSAPLVTVSRINGNISLSQIYAYYDLISTNTYKVSLYVVTNTQDLSLLVNTITKNSFPNQWVFLNNQTPASVTSGTIVPSVDANISTFVGEIKEFAGSQVSSGFLLCDGKTIGSSSSEADYTGSKYYSLYQYIWEGSTTYVIYTSGGSVSTRGASALADFNANKRLAIPDFRGRISIGYDFGSNATPTNVTTEKQLNYKVTGNTGGEAFHLLTSNESGLRAHSHFNGVSDDGSDLFVYGGTTTGMPGLATQTILSEGNARTTQGNTSTNTALDAVETHENRQPYIVVTKQIRYI